MKLAFEKRNIINVEYNLGRLRVYERAFFLTFTIIKWLYQQCLNKQLF